MIKFPRYPLLVILLFSMVGLFGASNTSHEGNWLAIVQKRLELEQKPVDVVLKGVNPENKKNELNSVLLFYKNGFEELYNALMVIFKESDDWITLREYLIQSNKILDGKYNQLKAEYVTKFEKKREIPSTEFASYVAGVNDYYIYMMEVLKKVITDGQAQEVALRKAEVKEMRKQERRKKSAEEGSVWTEVE